MQRQLEAPKEQTDRTSELERMNAYLLSELERDSENCVLSADEQDKLVTKFLLKLVATPYPNEIPPARR